MTTPDSAPSHLFETYQLSVEMADRVSARRATSNAFFLAVQSALVAVIGLRGESIGATPTYIVASYCAAGMAISVLWWLQLRSYRDLSTAKFKVINEIETSLPTRPFTDEWDYLKSDPIKPWRQRYAELGTSERIVPWVFLGIYVVIFVGRMRS